MRRRRCSRTELLRCLLVLTKPNRDFCRNITHAKFSYFLSPKTSQNRGPPKQFTSRDFTKSEGFLKKLKNRLGNNTMKGSIEAGTYVHCVIFKKSVPILPVRFPRIFVFFEIIVMLFGLFRETYPNRPGSWTRTRTDGASQFNPPGFE